MHFSSSDKSQSKQPQGNVFLSERLVGQDERLDHLVNLFEMLQLATVETCNPTLDLLTFVQSAYYFAVIMKKISLKPGEGPKVFEPEKRENKRKFLDVSHCQAGVSEENTSNAKESSEKYRYERTYLSLLKAQAMEITNEGVTGTSSNLQDPFAQGVVSTRHVSQNLWYEHNNTQSTWEVDPISLHHDYSLDGDQFLPPGLETGGPYDDSVVPEAEAIGLVYLVDLASSVRLKDRIGEGKVMSTRTNDTTEMFYEAIHAQELNIGIILEPSHRGQGYAHQVMEMVLGFAFKTAKCHRVQAILPDHVAKDRAICFFTQMRFDHEGTRRRAFFSPMEHVYKDVTYMGMLDTDWILRQTDRKRSQKPGNPAPKSTWDELLSRHEREREELLNWEAGIRYSQTFRSRTQTPTQSCFRTTQVNDEDDETGDEIGADKTSTSKKGKLQEGKIKRKTLLRKHEGDPFATASHSDSISERSASPGGYLSAASSSCSAWDMVEPSDSDFDSSFASSSSLESGDEEAFEFARGTSQSV
ncbi:hypothetical protein E4T56_gene10748 [Termitomyces sp. T112]|nr:hypothetical protein E4T56_gene10748 [Termitomyces sp. T112]